MRLSGSKNMYIICVFIFIYIIHTLQYRATYIFKFSGSSVLSLFVERLRHKGINCGQANPRLVWNYRDKCLATDGRVGSLAPTGEDSQL